MVSLCSDRTTMDRGVTFPKSRTSKRSKASNKSLFFIPNTSQQDVRKVRMFFKHRNCTEQQMTLVNLVPLTITSPCSTHSNLYLFQFPFSKITLGIPQITIYQNILHTDTHIQINIFQWCLAMQRILVFYTLQICLFVFCSLQGGN